MERMKKICDIIAISGREKRIREFIKSELNKYTKNVESDFVGNTFGIINEKCGGVKIMITSHMDEVGMMVLGITNNGFLKITPIGGLDPKVVLSQPVLVETKDGELIPGVIGAVPPHLGKNKDLEIESLLVDVGALSKEEALDWGIEVGSQVTFSPNFYLLKNKNRVVTKAADNRLGTAIVLDLAESLSKKKLNNTIIIGATVQEEVGLRGASVIKNKYKPDLVLAIDVSPASDTSEQGPDLAGASLGKGFLLRVIDYGTIMPDGLRKYIKSLAIKNSVLFQEFRSKGGTDAISFQTNSLATTIGLPGRYIHSSQSIVDLKDVSEVKKIVELICEDLTRAKFQKIIEG